MSVDVSSVSELSPDFTMNSLIDTLRDLMMDEDQEALTTREMEQALGVSQKKVYRLLDELGDDVIVVRKKITNRVGHQQTVPAYRLKNDELSE